MVTLMRPPVSQPWSLTPLPGTREAMTGTERPLARGRLAGTSGGQDCCLCVGTLSAWPSPTLHGRGLTGGSPPRAVT